MFKHRLIPNLIEICKQHLITLTGLLIFIIGTQNVHPQQQIALDTYAIFQQRCLICHGPNGAYKETLLMEHDALIEKGSVVPGNPDASELYNRLITTDTAKRMPLGQLQLPAQSINTIRNWILAGTPDWAATSTTDGDFISPAEILNTIETHLMSLAPFDRAYARYFTMTHLYNAGEPVGILQEYRKGLYKLINSLSWGSTVINPQPIDPQGTILYIDLRHYEWDVNDAWTQIESAYPYHISYDAPAQTALKAQLTRLQTEMACDMPSVHIDWFLANASLPPLYHNLLSLPSTDRELETRLEVDVARNLQNAPGVRVWRAGTNNSGVSNNNRVIERHTSQHGAYWKSYDFAGSVGTQNIFNHPLSFTHDGGEVIFNLPNGLQGYYITNASGSRLDAAPINIVSNPAASDPTVRNGLSCFGCHTEGMKTVADQVRPVIVSDTNPTYDKAQALRLYVEKSRMDALIAEDTARYRGALAATGGAVDDIEPIARFHEAFQGEVDAAHAAAAVGLETETFLEKIRENIGLQNAGLLVLDSPNGSMKRDAWRSNFPAIIYALDFPGEQVDSPSQPDQPPGTVVRIPDTNLRAVIAEELGKGPNAPITVEEMKRLDKLYANGRGIQDLTGLQFATNVSRLRLTRNQISDLSPLAGLIELRALSLYSNPVSDISPLKGLKNLTHLSLTNSPVSDLSSLTGLTALRTLELGDRPRYPHTLSGDLSPLAGLINLTSLVIHNFNGSDLSPLAGLINLEVFGFDGREVSDLSPLAGLISLKRIRIWGSPISDLSPLVRLPKLENLNICGADLSDPANMTLLVDFTGLKELYFINNKISDISHLAGLTGLTRLNLKDNQITDISPIAGLTNLKWLNLARNEISDVSPLLGLTNLTWLGVDQNNISDLSPLEELRKKIKVFWSGNPGIPKGGPKIEGPWLWVLLPDTGLDRGVDVLSDASGGIVTELTVATHGATVGQPVGDEVWESNRLPSEPQNNIGEMLGHDPPDGVIYGSVSIYSPRGQETTLHVGADDGLKVWLNGTLVYSNFNIFGSGDYTDFAPVTLQQGLNVLLVAVQIRGSVHNGKFGFKPGTEYTVANTGVEYTISPATIHRGETFTLDIRARNVSDLMGWQFDIVFDRAALEAVDVTEGDFLKTGAATFFQSGSIDNGRGQITGLTAARLSTQSVSGTGTLVKARFKAKASGESEVTLRNFQFVSLGGDTIDAIAHGIRITVEGRLTRGDINRDGVVTIADLVLVAQQLNQRVSAGSAADINGDGIVNTLDLIIVAQAIGSTTAPAAPPTIPTFPLLTGGPTISPRLTGDPTTFPPPAGLRGVTTISPAMIEAWIAQARLEDDGSLAFKQGIENLEKLLASLIPEETALLANYPNPFNPETWIPYQLAESGEVTLTIYDMNGHLVRHLAVGHQAAGIYRSRSRAAYWDGRNQLGESVASGLYFYTLTAGDFTATRRMLILK